MRLLPWFAGAGVGVAALAILTKSTPAAIPASFPNVVLWAWETKQDLRFIKPGTAGVAFLERTVSLHPQRVRSFPRGQSFAYTPGTPLIATVRMESTRSNGLPVAREAALAAAEAARVPGLSALQIDFDARLSERIWYAEFLRELRKAVPKTLPISITALESWCEDGHSWLERVAVAEAVPMLFRMGLEENRTPLSFPASVCNSSVGISTDEMPERIPHAAQRIYIFHPGAWTESAYESAMEQVRQWRHSS